MSGGSQIFFGAATPACWTVQVKCGCIYPDFVGGLVYYQKQPTDSVEPVMLGARLQGTPMHVCCPDLARCSGGKGGGVRPMLLLVLVVPVLD